jgi:hypothetical protein
MISKKKKYTNLNLVLILSTKIRHWRKKYVDFFVTTCVYSQDLSLPHTHTQTHTHTSHTANLSNIQHIQEQLTG